tara:strand:+ start:17089 stop:17334 length:246 start_codon:yes stop_codon:yes gene_type:complete
MKTKIFKIVLPAFAILLALGFAFANEAKTMDNPKYYEHPVLGIKEVPIEIDCPEQGETSCTYNGFPVYADSLLTTPLFERE